VSGGCRNIRTVAMRPSTQPIGYGSRVSAHQIDQSLSPPIPPIALQPNMSATPNTIIAVAQ
jgi:hypothetical protein